MNRDLGDLFSLLDRLHRLKDSSYGDAWRKRGEILGIFSNIARKYDRMTGMLDDARPATGEAVTDTLADLCVYAVKYVTWLAEHHPDAFDQVDLRVAADLTSASSGPDAVTAIFDAINSHSAWGGRLDGERARSVLDRAFGRLDRGMQAQANGQAALDPEARITIALELATASAWLLLHTSSRDPTSMLALRRTVEEGE